MIGLSTTDEEGEGEKEKEGDEESMEDDNGEGNLCYDWSLVFTFYLDQNLESVNVNNVEIAQVSKAVGKFLHFCLLMLKYRGRWKEKER
jgi:hypothetical protein